MFDVAALWDLPLGHEQDHLDGMTHNADGRVIEPPKCGRNRD